MLRSIQMIQPLFPPVSDPNEVALTGMPFGRAGTPQDIANGVLVLSSDASNYRTGAELVIDGRMTSGARPRWS